MPVPTGSKDSALPEVPEAQQLSLHGDLVFGCAAQVTSASQVSITTACGLTRPGTEHRGVHDRPCEAAKPCEAMRSPFSRAVHWRGQLPALGRLRGLAMPLVHPQPGAETRGRVGSRERTKRRREIREGAVQFFFWFYHAKGCMCVQCSLHLFIMVFKCSFLFFVFSLSLYLLSSSLSRPLALFLSLPLLSFSLLFSSLSVEQYNTCASLFHVYFVFQ